ncbi:MAG: hypothetical protein ACI4I6_05430 [Hominimerdicola sp.]
MLTTIYPKNYYECPDGIYYNGEQFSNAYIRVTDYYEQQNVNSSVSTVYLNIAFITKHKSYQVMIPAFKLDKVNKYVPLDFVYFNASESKVNNFLMSTIRATIMNETPKKQYKLEQGYNVLKVNTCENKQTLFLFGNRIIGNVSNISEQLACHERKCVHFKCSPKYENVNFIPWLEKFVNTETIPSVLLIAALVPFVSPLINEKRRNMFYFNTYICGKTGSGKSEITKILVDYFEGMPNMVNLQSDREAINRIFEYKHCCVAVDDLCESVSNEEKRRNEKKLQSCSNKSRLLEKLYMATR